MRNRTVMIAQLLSQPCKRGSHFFAFQQRFHSLLVNFGPLFADIEALLYFSRRNDNYAVSIRHNQISGVDHEWVGLFGRSELHRAVQSRCPRESVRAQGRRSLCEDLNAIVADQHTSTCVPQSTIKQRHHLPGTPSHDAH